MENKTANEKTLASHIHVSLVVYHIQCLFFLINLNIVNSTDWCVSDDEIRRNIGIRPATPTLKIHEKRNSNKNKSDEKKTVKKQECKRYKIQNKSRFEEEKKDMLPKLKATEIKRVCEKILTIL